MEKNETLLKALYRQDFYSFLRRVFAEVASNATFQANWHIEVIIHYLQLAMEGNEKRLIINLPPRHLKSIICSVALPAYILGKNPRERILCVSYAEELSSKLALDCRRVMESAWYKAAFPGTRLSPARRSISDFETTLGGGHFSTSIGGTITGRGGNYLIIDDPIKPADADSEVLREKVNDSYGTTLYSRLDNKKEGRIIVVMQRSHENDFTGYLLATDPSFKQIKMPIVAEEDERWTVHNRITGKEKTYYRKVGELLHPSRDSEEEVNRMREILGSYNFAGQYQQNPTSRGGNVIKREWLKFYNPQELHQQIINGQVRPLALMQSWDTASKIGEDNDFSVCITGLLVEEGKIYILDVFRDKLALPDLIHKAEELIKQAEQTYKRWWSGSIQLLYEDVASGIGFGQALSEKYICTPIPITPIHDKATRLINISNRIENGECLFPNNMPVWWEAFERELITFPHSKHDDQCDALSQLLSQPPKLSILDVI